MEITLNVHFYLPSALIRLLETLAAPSLAATVEAPLEAPEVASAETPRKKRGPKALAALATSTPVDLAPAPTQETPAPSLSALTPKDLGKVLQETIAVAGLPKASTVFTKFKAGRILDVKPEDYPAFVKYCLDVQAQFKTEATKA